jgi:hypothetical protein
MSGGIRLEFIRPDELTEATIDALHAVASESLIVCREWLGRKLRGFDHVVLFRDPRRSTLAGCTGIKILDVEQAGRGVRILYTGAVFLGEAWQGKNLIQRAGIASMLRYGLTRRRLYWLSECDSFRPYLMGMRNFRDAWPRHDQESPAFETTLLESVCPTLFEDNLEPGDLGVVRHPRAPAQAPGRDRAGTASPARSGRGVLRRAQPGLRPRRSGSSSRPRRNSRCAS